MCSQGPAFGEGLNQPKKYVHLSQKSGEGGGKPPPSPCGSEPLFEKSSFTCNGSQRVSVRDTNDIDFQFDEQPYSLNLPAVYR